MNKLTNMKDNIKKKEKFCKFYTIFLIVFLSIICIFSFIVSIISGIEDLPFSKEIFGYVSLGIFVFSFLFLLVNSSIALNNISKLANKTSIFIEKKEYSQGITYATSLRNRSYFTQTFKTCTIYIGYLNMFIENKEEAYNELSYFLNKRIASYLDFFVLYLLYTVCIILKKDEDIKKIQENYQLLLKKYKRKINKDIFIFKFKNLIDNLISNNIEEGLSYLVKFDCKLVINYLNSK